MSIRFAWLQRDIDEDLTDYKLRLESAGIVHTGYAYFGANSYDESDQLFRIVINWNGEMNSHLINSLPSYGYVLNCDLPAADELKKQLRGLPIDILFTEKNGFPIPLRINLNFGGNDYEVYYLGINFYTNDFFDFRNPVFYEGKDEYDELFTSGSFNAGSFIMSSFVFSSFRPNSYNVSSYNISSYNAGFYNASSFNVSSFNLSSFVAGAFGSGSYYKGSFNTSSFNKISHNEDSYIDYRDKYRDLFGIGYLGYGLNLI